MVGMPRHMVMLATEERESPGRLGLLLSFPIEYASLFKLRTILALRGAAASKFH